MTISEPTTLLTNAVLAVAAAALGLRLLEAGRAPSHVGTRLWAGAFLAGATAALAGGLVHGFGPSLAPWLKAFSWKVVLAGVGCACFLLLAGSSFAALRRTARRACLGIAALQLALYLALVAVSNDIRLAAGYAAATIVELHALGLAIARDDGQPLKALVGGLALSPAGIAAQQARVMGPAPFNHNDVCHVIQTVALWPFYRAGLRLRDREG